MKYTSLIALFTMLYIGVKGQSHLIGVKSGFSRTNISSNSRDYIIQNNFIAGITYDYKVYKNLSLGCEFLFEERGGNISVSFTDANGNLEERYTIPYEYNYLSLPIKLSYTFGEFFFGYGSIGFCPAILKKATVTYPEGYLSHFVDPFLTIQPTYSEYDLAGLGEIGIGYKFKDRFSINMSARFQHSFTSLIENEGERNFGTTFGLSLKYYL